MSRAASKGNKSSHLKTAAGEELQDTGSFSRPRSSFADDNDSDYIDNEGNRSYGSKTSEQSASELTVLRSEFQSMQDMLDESMNTLVTLNERLSEEKDTNSELLQRVEEAEHRADVLEDLARDQDAQISDMQREIDRLRRQLKKSRRANLNDSLLEALPAVLINPDDSISSGGHPQLIRGALQHAQYLVNLDKQLAASRDEVLDSLRHTGEVLCARLVEADEDESALLARHAGLVFTDDSDSDKDKQQGATSALRPVQSAAGGGGGGGFLYGVPSRRYNVSRTSISEDEEVDVGEEDEEEKVEEELLRVAFVEEQEKHSGDCDGSHSDGDESGDGGEGRSEDGDEEEDKDEDHENMENKFMSESSRSLVDE